MKILLATFLSLFFYIATFAQDAVFIETESFEDKGGWFIDQQSMDVMGSPYLIAHGMGKPVKDAVTTITFPKKGKYHVFIRTRNWTARWSDQAAGKFEILVNGKSLGKTFGTQDQDWGWVEGGKINIKDKKATIALHDLTGFNGRCDAIYFTTDETDIPPNDLASLDELRSNMLGLNKTPKERKYDFVVIGGGMAGTCAAISAARLGVKVALVQNRPVLGGNNSTGTLRRTH